ncbi:unnamed protein product [Clonostachys rosea f. rosea IK726]|uniref:Increased loss of mitochondrial DNA protein 1 n=3 Tax=Clonostachys TaxID=110564 RepID=A0A8H7K4T5_BIOOC|nr:unnamed protein product [Clonostachys rosea f. rosea IK726]CAH0036258.1 unnamed protein product [Clonostachys rhizophaga]
MALIASTTIITSVSLFHLTLAFFFLSNPRTINEQALVWVLGNSMGMPNSRGFESQSHPLGLLSVVLALVGISDLVSLSMPEEITLIYYWGAQAPIRSLFFMIVLFYAFLTGPSSPFFASVNPRGRFAHPSAHNPSYTPGTWGGDTLKNRVAFTFLFLEMISWFWVWLTLREERQALVHKLRKRSGEDKDD